MKERPKSTVSCQVHKPFAKAVGATVLLFAVVLSVDACTVVTSTFSDLRILATGEQGEDFFVMSSEGRQSLGTTQRLPPEFAEELFSTNGFYDVRIDETGSVVGLLAKSSVEETYAMCKQTLQDKGWTVIESGLPFAATCMKKTGTFNWAYISCLAVADEVSVTVQLIEEGRGNGQSTSYDYQ